MFGISENVKIRIKTKNIKKLKTEKIQVSVNKQ